MTSAYVPEESPVETMTRLERSLRMVVVLVVAAGVAALLMW